MWEGLFFMFWHADKSLYQRDVSLKIAKILPDLSSKTESWDLKQKQWFEACLYIFNKHWDKVDNFRIDKYLMLVRNIFSAVFSVLKKTGYQEADLDWLN